MISSKHIFTLAAILFITASPAQAEPVGIKDWEQLLSFVTDVKRGAAAQAVASDSDASPAIEVKGNKAGAGLFGVADTGMMEADRDDTHAEASAKNGSFGRHLVYSGDKKNVAGKNGAYSSYAAITWKGKIVKDGINAQFDPDRANEIHQIVGDRLRVDAQSNALFRLSLAYKIVDLNNADDSWWGESLYFDNLIQDHGFSKLFDGTIEVGDASKSVFSGDFSALSSLFDSTIDPLTHTGSISYRYSDGVPVDFVVPMPFFSSSQMLLLAADQQAYVNAAHGGVAVVETTVPEPSMLFLIFSGGLAMLFARRTANRHQEKGGQPA